MNNPKNYFLNQIINSKEPNEFEKKYFEYNFAFQGFDFNKEVFINIGEKTQEYMSSQLSLQVPNRIKCDGVLGETDKVWHLKFKNRNFFIYKEDSDNPYVANYTSLNIDFEKYNSTNSENKILKNFQETGVKFMVSTSRGFLFDDQGLGKTIQSIVAALETGCKKILIVTLASTKQMWKRAIEEYGATAKIIEGENNFDKSPAQFTIINYDIIAENHKTGGKKPKTPMYDEKYEVIILDEVHKIKNASQQAKAVSDLCNQKYVKYVWGLSGTPFEKNLDVYNILKNCGIVTSITPNGLDFLSAVEVQNEFLKTFCGYNYRIPRLKSETINKFSDFLKTSNSFGKLTPQELNDIKRICQSNRVDPLWLAYYMLDHFGSFERYYYKWAKYNGATAKLFLVPSKDESDINVNNKNSQAISTILKPLYLRRMKTDVLSDFPEKFVNTLYMKLTSEEKLQYDNAYSSYLEATGKEENLLTEKLKLRQFLANLKCEQTCNFVRGLVKKGKKVIVFTHFDEEREKLIECLGDGFITIHSSMGAKKIDKAIQSFQNDDKYVGIIGNIKTLGTGHNITKATDVVNNSPDYNSGEHEQGADRAYRLGQKNNVNVWFPIFQNTEEHLVYLKAIGKKENNDTLFS